MALPYLIEAQGDLTIKNGSVECAGRGIHVSGQHTVNLENVKMTAVERCFGGYNGCTVNVDKDCELTTIGDDATFFVYGDANTGDLENTVKIAGKIVNKFAKIEGGKVVSGGWAVCGNGNGNRAKSNIVVERTAEIVSEHAPAIYHPQAGVLTINGGKIEGTDGIYLKSGKLVVNAGNIHGTADADYEYFGNGTITVGHGIVVDFAKYPNGMPDLEVNGGTITSEHKDGIGYYVNPNYTDESLDELKEKHITILSE